jgi:hypothetical protein
VERVIQVIEGRAQLPLSFLLLVFFSGPLLCHSILRRFRGSHYHSYIVVLCFFLSHFHFYNDTSNAEIRIVYLFSRGAFITNFVQRAIMLATRFRGQSDNDMDSLEFIKKTF